MRKTGRQEFCVQPLAAQPNPHSDLFRGNVHGGGDVGPLRQKSAAQHGNPVSTRIEQRPMQPDFILVRVKSAGERRGRKYFEPPLRLPHGSRRISSAAAAGSRQSNQCWASEKQMASNLRSDSWCNSDHALQNESSRRAVVEMPGQFVHMERPQIASQQVPEHVQRGVRELVGGMQRRGNSVRPVHAAAAAPRIARDLPARKVRWPGSRGENAVRARSENRHRNNRHATASRSCEPWSANDRWDARPVRRWAGIPT